MIYVFQWIILGTYFYVTYRPELKKIDVKKIMKRWVVAIFGKEAANCIFAEIEANKKK